MNKNLLLLSILIAVFGLMSFQLSKSVQKKVNKEIESTFKVKDFDLELISIPQELNSELKTNIKKGAFYKINSIANQIGYCFIGKAPSKADDFDYLVLFDNDKIIKKIKILVYREDYGAEIGSHRWLRQFIGVDKSQNLNYSQDIIAISGATISARSLTIEVNNLLQSIVILDNKNALN